MFGNTIKLNLIRSLRSFSVVAEDTLVNATVLSTSAPANKNSELTKIQKGKPRIVDLAEVSKVLRPGALSSMYINKSEILQQLVKLKVKLYEIEKDPEATKFILSQRFEDIKDKIIFLKELGLEIEDIGNTITKNPLILKENIEDLQVRINYLQYKKFTSEMILRIVSANPHWLSHSTQDIDNKLGFFQSNFSLTGNEVRLLATKSPKLITYPLEKVKLAHFVLKEEMGFKATEIKKMVLDRPQLLKSAQDKLLSTFEYLHNTMKIPLEIITIFPEVLNCRVKRLKERHLFLARLKRDLYNPKEPNYVALKTLVSGTDSYFCTEVAQSSVQVYNEFLKSL
uniref:Transcription termination factor 3, mitochondrial n=1 Tax=Diabrotica virgifera virgifera TaxID=50390 RepID=A0A6P7FQ46_DIAVI